MVVGQACKLVPAGKPVVEASGKAGAVFVPPLEDDPPEPELVPFVVLGDGELVVG
jgi:hypothetical protein